MLRTIEIDCPNCQQRTPISVSTGNGGEKETSGTFTGCRRCRTRLTTVTLQDGRIIVQKFDASQTQPLANAIVVLPDAKVGSIHGVLPPGRLDIFGRSGCKDHPKGVSDEDLRDKVVSLSDIFWRPDGSRRTEREVAKFSGWRSIWVAQLNEALEARLAGPPPLTYTPGIFLP